MKYYMLFADGNLLTYEHEYRIDDEGFPHTRRMKEEAVLILHTFVNGVLDSVKEYAYRREGCQFRGHIFVRST